MSHLMPTQIEIENLLAYLPLFERPGKEFIKQWDGGEKQEDGSTTMSYPVYDDDVCQFFRLLSQPCWTNTGYDPKTAAKMLKDKQFVANADLPSIRTMLTYCMRGERFNDGFWGAVLKSGQVVDLLKRLQQIQESSGATPSETARG